MNKLGKLADEIMRCFFRASHLEVLAVVPAPGIVFAQRSGMAFNKPRTVEMVNMRIKVCLVIVLSFVTGSVGWAEVQERSPLETVNLRMEAYNNHDLESFLSLYSEAIEVFTYPDKKLSKGKDHLRSIFEPMFKETSVSVEIHHQFTKDGYVINHETVNYDGSLAEYLSIYEVRKGLITSVRFVRD